MYRQLPSLFEQIEFRNFVRVSTSLAGELPNYVRGLGPWTRAKTNPLRSIFDRHSINCMKHLLVALLVFGSVSSAFAQQAKVIKVKGNQAIVQFPKNSPPSVGQTIDLSGGSRESSRSGGGGSTGPRNNSIGVSAVIASLSTSNNVRGSASTSVTTIEIAGRYGWNAETMEYGPLGSVSRISTDGGSATTIKVGGFFDYNLVPNTTAVDMVYGLGAEASIGQSSPSQGDSASTMGFAGGGFLKWFLLGTSTAFRGDLQFFYERSSAGDVISSTSGPLAKVGFQVYF